MFSPYNPVRFYVPSSATAAVPALLPSVRSNDDGGKSNFTNALIIRSCNIVYKYMIDWYVFAL